jgi:DNA-directed RNA polymerase specialized sigma24 family protein
VKALSRSSLVGPRYAAIESLPPLPHALFLLHNFYGVDVEAMADTLNTDGDTIAACLADARAILRARVCYTDPVPDVRPATAALQGRLQQDYRRSIATAFAESGYSGKIAWPDPIADIAADQKVAAAFIVAALPAALRRAVAHSRCDDAATIDLWRTVWPWRKRFRRKLLRVTDALQCAGWEPFDEWLAERLSLGRRYPHGYVEYRRRRRPFPEERPMTEAEKNGEEVSDTVQIPARLVDQPDLTRQVWILFDRYGRPFEEIAPRLGISRRSAGRHLDRANYAIIDMSYPSLAERVRFDLMVRKLGFQVRWEIIRSAFYG